MPQATTPTNQLTEEMIREIYRQIAAGEQRRGSFLTKFAQAIVHSDGENFNLLKSAATTLIDKYNLNQSF